MTGEVCPISRKRVDETVSRMNGVVVFTALVAASAFDLPWLLALLALDFGLKVATWFRFSPLSWSLCRVRDALGRRPRPADAAPKRFAALLGLAFTLCALLLRFLLPGSSAWQWAAMTCSFCAALEGFAGYCVGCKVYSLLVLPLASRPSREAGRGPRAAA